MEVGRNRGETSPHPPRPQPQVWEGRGEEEKLLQLQRCGAAALGAGLRPGRDEVLLQPGQEWSAVRGVGREGGARGVHPCPPSVLPQLIPAALPTIPCAAGGATSRCPGRVSSLLDSCSALPKAGWPP